MNKIFSKLLLQAFFSWLPLAITIISLSGLLFVSVQQSARLSANDTIKETATNLVSVIDSGVTFEQLKSTTPVDITKDNSFIYIVYDKDKNVVASNVKDIETYSIPGEVLDIAKANGSNSITWQPTDSVRLATYTVPFSGANEGYVLTSRTLYATESNATQVLKIVSAGMTLTLISTLITALLLVLAQNSSILIKKTTSKINKTSELTQDIAALSKKAGVPETKKDAKSDSKVTAKSGSKKKKLAATAKPKPAK